MANKQIDITKVGPVGYKALQEANNAQYTGDSDFQEFRSKIGSRRVSQFDANLDVEQDVSSPLSQTSTPWGASFFDDEEANLNQFLNLGDIRAENQPWYSKIANGLAKGVVLAGTTFLDGTVGLVLGSGKGVSNMFDDDPNSGFLSGLWDNEFSQALQDVNEWAEKEIPNYYTQAETNDPWGNIFSANFIGDKFIKNLGFAVGALYSGSVATGALKATKIPQIIGALTKSSAAPAMVLSGVGAAISAVNEGRIEAIHATRDWYDKNRNIIDNTLQEELARIQKEYEVNSGKSMSMIGGPESGFALQDPAYAQYTKDIERVYADYDQALKKLEEDRVKMGNLDMLSNLPILLASNFFQFGKIYANGYNTARRLTNAATLAKNSKWSAAGVVARTSLMEGTEEISQRAAAEISADYYTTDLAHNVSDFYAAKIDPEAEEKTLSFIRSFAEGINKTVNDSSAWEEFFIGALTGALGVPGFRSTRNAQGEFQSPVYLQGGLYNTWKERQEQVARAQELMNYINNRVQSPEFINYYQGLIRHNKYQADMDAATLRGDSFDYKNAEHAQLLSDIMMFDNAGKLDELVALVESAYDTSDSNLEAIVNNTTSTAEDGSTIGPFVDKKGNPLYSTPEGKNEMISKLNQNYQDIKNTINNYRKIKNDLDIHTGGVFTDEQLQELTWMKAQIQNWESRADEMSSDVKSAINPILNTFNKSLYSTQQLKFQYDLSTKGITDISLDFEQKIKDLERTINDLTLLRDMDSKSLLFSLANNPEYLKYLIERVGKLDTTTISADEKTHLINNLNDINRLSQSYTLYSNKLKEYLENPGTQQIDHQNVVAEAESKQSKRQQQAFRDKLNQTTTLQEYKTVLEEEADSEAKQAVLNELKSNKDPKYQAYEQQQSYNRSVVKQLRDLELDDETLQDALLLFNNHVKNSNTLEDTIDKDAIDITDNLELFNNLLLDEDTKLARYEKAKNALQLAMENVDSKVTEHSSKPKPVSGVSATTEESNNTTSETTGNSQTSVVPLSNENKPQPDFDALDALGEQLESNVLQESDDLEIYGQTFIPAVGNITNQNLDTTNRDLNKSNTEQNSIPNGGKLYLAPIIPELHIASTQSDTNPQFLELPDVEPNFKNIYNFLKDNGAFSYVNEGNVKAGDTIYFAIIPQWEQQVSNESWHTAPTIFMMHKDSKGVYHIVGSLPESQGPISKTPGLAKLINDIREEYNKHLQESSDESSKENTFISPTLKTTVSKIMIGKIPYQKGNEQPINSDTYSNIEFMAIANNTITFGEGSDLNPSDVYIRDTTNQEGRLYTLIPNGAGTYSPMAIRVKHFNKAEFDLENTSMSNTPRGTLLNNLIETLLKVSSREDMVSIIQELKEVLYLGDIDFRFITNSDDSSSIQISRLAKDSNGVFIVRPNNEGETGIHYKRENINKVKLDTKFSKTQLINTLYSFNVPFQVSIQNLNNKAYMKSLMDSGILTSNVISPQIRGTWFTTDYIDENGVQQPAVNPQSATEPKVQTETKPIDTTPKGIKIKTAKGNDVYVDLDNKSVNHNGTIVTLTQNPNIQRLLDLAKSYQEHGSSLTTAGDNLIDDVYITEEGKYLDRKTQNYITDENRIKEIQEKLTKRNEEISSQQEDPITTPQNTQSKDNLLKPTQKKNIKTRPKFRTVDTSKSYKRWNRQKELAWLNQVLPQLSLQDKIQILEDLVKIDNNPEAWGAINEGIMQLSNIADEGTVYHEAFHVVFNGLLTEQERQEILTEARTKFPKIKHSERAQEELLLEEALAEDFREFVMIQEAPKSLKPFRKILNFFKRLFTKTTHWKTLQPHLFKLYQNINNGYYADKIINNEALKNVTRSRSEELTDEMKSIKEKAISDGTFMLAPNGNPTNLTERQWLHVRTKAFKDWFGDWERVANKDNEITLSFDREGYHGSFLNDLEFIGEGSEFAVYRKGNKVIKISEPYYSDQFESRINNALLIDSVNNLNTKLIGFYYSQDSKGNKFKNPIFEQDFIEGEEATEEQIDNELKNRGFTKDTSASPIKFVNNHTGVSISDVYSGNAFISNGKVVFIDADITGISTNDSVSKVVDENGEPKVVYHGSKAILTEFDSSKSESKQYLSEQIKPTNFFSSDKTVADFFAVTEKQSLASQISKAIDIVLDAFAGEYVDEDVLDDEIWTEAARRTGKSKKFVKDFWKNKVPRAYKIKDEFGNTIMEDPDIDKYKYDVFINMKNPIILDAKGERVDRFIEANKEILNNSDEVIIKNIDETVGKQDTATDYLVRKSNLIKSATDNVGTYSTTNNDIRFRTIPSSQLEQALEQEYEYVKNKVRFLNTKVYLNPEEARQAYRKAGLNETYFNGITNANPNGAKGYKIKIMTKEDFANYKNSRINENIMRESRFNDAYNTTWDSLKPEQQIDLMNDGITKEDFNTWSEVEKRHKLECG